MISQADLDQVTPTVTEGVTSTIPGESKLLHNRSIQFEETAYAICSNYQLDRRSRDAVRGARDYHRRLLRADRHGGSVHPGPNHNDCVRCCALVDSRSCDTVLCDDRNSGGILPLAVDADEGTHETDVYHKGNTDIESDMDVDEHTANHHINHSS